MEIILIVVVVVLAVYLVWPKNKKPGTPITKSRTSPDMADPDMNAPQEEVIPTEAEEVPKQYFTPKTEVSDTSNFFYRKKVCIRGDFAEYSNHRRVAKELWELGADIKSSLDEKCELLICGEDSNPSACASAEEQGVKVMYESEFIEKLKGIRNTGASSR